MMQTFPRVCRSSDRDLPPPAFEGEFSLGWRCRADKRSIALSVATSSFPYD